MNIEYMIDKKQVEYVAKLARLGLKKEEIDKMESELSSILNYFKTLDELDVSQTSPTFYPISLKNVTREDEVEKKDKEEVDELISQTLAREERYIKVREILK